MKAKYFIFHISYFIFHISYSQNLVPNYSFEILSSCPTSWSQLYKAPTWFRPTAGDPDLYHTCATATAVHVPNGSMGYQFPKTGVAYAGLYIKTGTGNVREYMETQLTTSLMLGKRYCATMYVSLCDSCWEAVGNIGIYFSKDSVLKDTLNYFGALTTLTPQINNSPTNYLSDKKNWMEIKGIFTAVGGEKFMTIGNFYDNTNTPFINVGAGIWALSYYYVDDISVVELPEATELTGGDKIICRGDSVLLGAAQKINVSYSWSAGGGLSNEYIAQPYARPSVTTTYTLTVSDTSVVCANSSTAVVTVTVKQDISVDAGRDTVVCDSKPVLLGTVAQPNCRYIWKPSTWLNDSTLAQPTTSPYGSITYYLSVSDTSFGAACTALTDSVKIYLKQDCPFPTPGKNSFYIPTAFSPNGDNNNDVLYVYGKNIQGLTFEMYNRWGEKVFEQNCSPSPNYELPAPDCKGWDGKHKNENAEEGVYVWYAKVKFKGSDENVYKGTVLLVR